MIPCSQSRLPRAFTLMELLVVVGLVALLSAFLIRTFSNAGSPELRQAETTVAGLLRAARAAAIREARPARLVVNLDSDDRGIRLSYCAIIVSDGSGGWRVACAPISMPDGIRVVPDTAVPAVAGVAWPENATSRWMGTMLRPGIELPAGTYGYVNFSASGAVGVGSPKIIMSPVRWTAAGFEFHLPEQIRCFLVRPTGAATSLQELTSIP